MTTRRRRSGTSPPCRPCRIGPPATPTPRGKCSAPSFLRRLLPERIEDTLMATNISPRRPVNGKQLRADRTRAMVIDETVRCVIEEGFNAASANHITERAGVTWGVIQYHFGDRDGLLMAVVDKGFGRLLETLQGIEPELTSTVGHARAELVINAVADA